jgi:hypothetical protein
MFRLLKLAAYALFGYALYEFFRGLSDTGAAESGGGQRSMGGRRSGGARAMRGADRGEGQISGPGEGRPEATLDSDGGSVRHRVGRGVVRNGA